MTTIRATREQILTEIEEADKALKLAREEESRAFAYRSRMEQALAWADEKGWD